jgi:hypothetical protein
MCVCVPIAWPGRFGNTTELRTSSCSGLCAPGHVCGVGSVSSTAAPCGDALVYCPGGSSAPTPVQVGWYSTPESTSSALRTGEALCVPGEFCEGGVRRACSGGSFSALAGQTGCSTCPAGGCCPLASRHTIAPWHDRYAPTCLPPVADGVLCPPRLRMRRGHGSTVIHPSWVCVGELVLPCWVSCPCPNSYGLLFGG